MLGGRPPKPRMPPNAVHGREMQFSVILDSWFLIESLILGLASQRQLFRSTESLSFGSSRHESTLLRRTCQSPGPVAPDGSLAGLRSAHTVGEKVLPNRTQVFKSASRFGKAQPHSPHPNGHGQRRRGKSTYPDRVETTSWLQGFVVNQASTW